MVKMTLFALAKSLTLTMNIPEEYRFIIQLGRVLHKYGVPSFRIQEYLKEVADEQKIRGDFMDLPTWVNYVFYEEDDQQTYNYIRNTEPGSIDLGSLSRSVAITDSFLENKTSVSQARQALIDLEKSSSSYPQWMQVFAYGLSAATFVVMMQSNWLAVVVAFFVGLIVGVGALFSQRSAYLNSAIEAIAAFVATLLTGACYYFFPQINMTLNIIAAIIVFVPGLAMTTAIEEITSKSLVSGTAKLFDALLSLFKQFFGVMLGLAILINVVDMPTMQETASLPTWSSWVAIPLFLLSLMPVFNVRRQDIWGCVMIGFISFSLMITLEPGGLMMSTFLGAISVAILSKLLKRITKAPRLVFSTLGIIMLVPGSKAFIGLSTAFEMTSTAQSASHIGEQVVYVLMGIIGGLIFSGVFKKTRG